MSKASMRTAMLLVVVTLAALGASALAQAAARAAPDSPVESRPVGDDLSRVEVTPREVILSPGQVQQFTATGYDDLGNQIPITPTWSADGGPITQEGLYTAGSLPGHYPIIAAATAGETAAEGRADVQVTGPLPPDLGPGESYCHTFRYGGHYPYYDGWNPGMRGAVWVGPIPSEGPSRGGGVYGALGVTIPVSITAGSFAPPSVTVEISDTVCWTNLDMGSVDTGVLTHTIRGGVYRCQAFLPTALQGFRPPLPPRVWDPRLDDLGVTLEEAPITPWQPHWRLMEARWADPVESANRVNIFFEVLDADGERAMGQPVVVEWPDGQVTFPIVKSPPEPWGADFGMVEPLGSYDAYVGGGEPSDRIVGMGLGTPEFPDVKFHTSFYLTFWWIP